MDCLSGRLLLAGLAATLGTQANALQCAMWGYTWPTSSAGVTAWGNRRSITCAGDADVCVTVAYEVANPAGQLVGTSRGGCLDRSAYIDCDAYKTFVMALSDSGSSSSFWDCAICNSDVGDCNADDLGRDRFITPQPVDMMLLVASGDTLADGDWQHSMNGAIEFAGEIRRQVPGSLQVGGLQWSSLDWMKSIESTLWPLADQVGGTIAALESARKVGGGKHIALALSACGHQLTTYGQVGSAKVCIFFMGGGFTDVNDVYTESDYAGVWRYCVDNNIQLSCTVEGIANSLKTTHGITLVSVVKVEDDVENGDLNGDLLKLVTSCDLSKPASECQNIILLAGYAEFELQAGSIARSLTIMLEQFPRDITINPALACTNVYPFSDEWSCGHRQSWGDCDQVWMDGSTGYCQEACGRCDLAACDLMAGSCSDSLLGGFPWTDADGATCLQYEYLASYWEGRGTDEYCEQFGPIERAGASMAESCCFCGGGDTDCASLEVETQCTDLVSDAGTQWVDSQGVTCGNYALLHTYTNLDTNEYCALYSNLANPGTGHTAEEACCFCGGGTRRLVVVSRSPSPSPPPPALAPGCTCEDVQLESGETWTDVDGGGCVMYESLRMFTGYSLHEYCSQSDRGGSAEVLHHGISMPEACCFCEIGGMTVCESTEVPFVSLCSAIADSECTEWCNTGLCHKCCTQEENAQYAQWHSTCHEMTNDLCTQACMLTMPYNNAFLEIGYECSTVGDCCEAGPGSPSSSPTPSPIKFVSLCSEMAVPDEYCDNVCTEESSMCSQCCIDAARYDQAAFYSNCDHRTDSWCMTACAMRMDRYAQFLEDGYECVADVCCEYGGAADGIILPVPTTVSASPTPEADAEAATAVPSANASRTIVFVSICKFITDQHCDDTCTANAACPKCCTQEENAAVAVWHSKCDNTTDIYCTVQCVLAMPEWNGFLEDGYTCNDIYSCCDYGPGTTTSMSISPTTSPAPSDGPSNATPINSNAYVSICDGATNGEHIVTDYECSSCGTGWCHKCCTENYNAQLAMWTATCPDGSTSDALCRLQCITDMTFSNQFLVPGYACDRPCCMFGNSSGFLPMTVSPLPSPQIEIHTFTMIVDSDPAVVDLADVTSALDGLLGLPDEAQLSIVDGWFQSTYALLGSFRAVIGSANSFIRLLGQIDDINGALAEAGVRLTVQSIVDITSSPHSVSSSPTPSPSTIVDMIEVQFEALCDMGAGLFFEYEGLQRAVAKSLGVEMNAVTLRVSDVDKAVDKQADESVDSVVHFRVRVRQEAASVVIQTVQMWESGDVSSLTAAIVDEEVSVGVVEVSDFAWEVYSASASITPSPFPSQTHSTTPSPMSACIVDSPIVVMGPTDAGPYTVADTVHVMWAGDECLGDNVVILLCAYIDGAQECYSYHAGFWTGTGLTTPNDGSQELTFVGMPPFLGFYQARVMSVDGLHSGISGYFEIVRPAEGDAAGQVEDDDGDENGGMLLIAGVAGAFGGVLVVAAAYYSTQKPKRFRALRGGRSSVAPIHLDSAKHAKIENNVDGDVGGDIVKEVAMSTEELAMSNEELNMSTEELAISTEELFASHHSAVAATIASLYKDGKGTNTSAHFPTTTQQPPAINASGDSPLSRLPTTTQQPPAINASGDNSFSRLPTTTQQPSAFDVSGDYSKGLAHPHSHTTQHPPAPAPASYEAFAPLSTPPAATEPAPGPTPATQTSLESFYYSSM